MSLVFLVLIKLKTLGDTFTSKYAAFCGYCLATGFPKLSMLTYAN